MRASRNCGVKQADRNVGMNVDVGTEPEDFEEERVKHARRQCCGGGACPPEERGDRRELAAGSLRRRMGGDHLDAAESESIEMLTARVVAWRNPRRRPQ
mmetsp:Transcript_143947/g.460762  ORF Transcript_143947/g.460762 Transcript_143947/m.460762 type:complete len:99 (-) Transcript_143947:405-701(-)